ncbi:MAG: universal stress protein [Cyclobacteriaceae bacterium]
MKTILVPTDFSDQATYALDMAADIARKSNAQVQLLNVVEAPHGSSFSALGEVSMPDASDNLYFVRLIEAAKKKFDEMAVEGKYSDIKLEGLVEVGHPFEHISRSIAEHEVDLVVIGTRGSSGLEEIFVGSNTEKVVRRVDCPVLSVKSPVSTDSIKDIAFATNFRDDYSKLIEQLVKLQKVFDATIHLVSINTPSNFENDRYYKQAMKKFAEEYKLENYTMNVYNDDPEEDGIIYFAEDIDADMIALGTHGRTGISRLLSGSIAEDVVNHAKRPVWTFKL